LARPTASIDARLKRLREAKDRIAASAQPGTVLGFVPMMELLGVSRRTLQDWTRDIPEFDGAGCFNAGAQGVGYEFNPAATVWFLIHHFEMERRREIDAARKTREMVGGAQVLEALPEGFTLKEIQEAIRTSAMVREERIRSGEFVEVAPLRESLRAVFGTMQETLVTSASRADPTGQWPGYMRESFEDEIGRIGMDMVRAGETVLGDLNGGLA
jgi:hypothetical protein